MDLTAGLTHQAEKRTRLRRLQQRRRRQPDARSVASGGTDRRRDPQPEVVCSSDAVLPPFIPGTTRRKNQKRKSPPRSTSRRRSLRRPRPLAERSASEDQAVLEEQRPTAGPGVPEARQVRLLLRRPVIDDRVVHVQAEVFLTGATGAHGHARLSAVTDQEPRRSKRSTRRKRPRSHR